MKLKLLSVSLLLLTSILMASAGAGVPDSSRTIRILSYNILHGATIKGDFDLDLIASVIKKLNPDLVAHQEVDFKTRRAHGYDLITELGWRTGLAPLFGRAMYYDGGEYGEGILSRFSFISTRNHPLPYTGNHEPRAALEAVIVLPSGDTISFIGTHLDHTRDEADRIRQAHEINKILKVVRYPVILAGDLNAVPGSEPITILEKVWNSVYDKNNPVATFPSDNPHEKLDYVMFYPAERWRLISSEVVCDTVASDHCARLVVLELR